MAKSDRRIPPSRDRYEQAHPTVSFRVSREIYDRLQALKEAEGMSLAEILKKGLGILEAKVREEEKVREVAYSKGFEEGYLLAEEEYEVTYTCSVCHELITVTSLAEKEAIKQYMQEHGWGHAKCIDRR